jgi:hypothetical protein
MSVKEKALQYAMDRLNAIGARYKIITEDGAEFGDLPIAPPQRVRIKYVDIYKETLNKINVGEVARFDATGVSADGLRVAAHAYMCTKYKKGSAVSAVVNGNAVEILRVA